MGSFEGGGGEQEEVEVELVVSKNGGLHLKASDVEEAKVLEAEARVAKLDEGNILEAESSLREGLSLNYEVRPLLVISFLLSLFFILFGSCIVGSEA